MEPIDFSELVDWVKLRWESTVADCQADYPDFPEDYLGDDALPAKRFFECSFMMDSGTIKGEVATNSDGRDNCQLKCIVSHSVGSQDSSSDIETYAQTVSMNMRAPERWRGFVTRIWERFSTSLKSVTATIGGKSCVVTSDELPNYGPKTQSVIQVQDTSESFGVSFSFILVAFDGPLMSNLFSLTLGIYDPSGALVAEGPIPFGKVSYASACETTVNLDKETTKTNRQNFRALLVSLQAILPDSAISRAVITDAEDGTYFGHSYKLTKTGPSSTSVKWLITQKSAVTYVYGSLVSWEAEFIPFNYGN